MADKAELEAARPTQRFTSRVDDYVKARPGYPLEVVEVLQRKMSLSPSWTVADLGSGTGISAQMFLANGNTVFAVEPNAAMRSAAETWLGADRNFHSINAAAEATTLADRSVDLAVAAQAFHWFDVPAAAREVRRILKPGAWALLMWNDRLATGSPFLEAYEKLLLDFGTDYTKVQHRDLPERRQAKFHQFFGRDHELIELPNQQIFDLDGLRRRLLSSSYVPQPGDDRFVPMLTRLAEIFNTHHHHGRVTMAYQTQLYFAAPK